MHILSTDTINNIKTYVDSHMIVYKIPSSQSKLIKVIEYTFYTLGLNFEQVEYFCVDNKEYFTNITINFNTKQLKEELIDILGDGILDLCLKQVEAL